MLDRLKKALEINGLSGRGFFARLAKDTGYSAASMSVAFKNGEISDKLLRSICTTYGINEDWVRTGQGDMMAKHKIILRTNDMEQMVREVMEKIAGGGESDLPNVVPAKTVTINNQKIQLQSGPAKQALRKAINHVSEDGPIFYPRLDEAIMEAVYKMTASEVVDVLTYCHNILNKREKSQ